MYNSFHMIMQSIRNEPLTTSTHQSILCDNVNLNNYLILTIIKYQKHLPYDAVQTIDLLVGVSSLWLLSHEEGVGGAL